LELMPIALKENRRSRKNSENQRKIPRYFQLMEARD